MLHSFTRTEYHTVCQMPTVNFEKEYKAVSSCGRYKGRCESACGLRHGDDTPGYTFRILAQEKFRSLIEGKGVIWLHLSGDADRVLKYPVTDYKTSMDFFFGLMKLKRENPDFDIVRWKLSSES